MEASRRDVFKMLLVGAAAAPLSLKAAAAVACGPGHGAAAGGGAGIEGQRRADLGDDTYLISAVGSTAGPPTSHMVIAARSRSVHGLWENCPHNPLVRTTSVDEPWWSRGHASLVEGPGGDWWMVYHGYENGFHTGPANPAGADGVDRRRLVSSHRRRPFEALAKATRRWQRSGGAGTLG